MYRNLLIAIACIASFSTQAQDSNNINSDNTGFTMSPQTLGKKALQVEAGYTYFNGNYKFQDPLNFAFNHLDITNFRSESNLGVLKLRYGIFERFEISALYGVMALNYRTEYTVDEPRIGKDQENFFAFAVKTQIIKGSGLIPSVGASLDYNIGSYGVQKCVANIAAESRLFEKMGVRVNLGYIYEDDFHVGIQINYSVTDRWKVFGEYSGNIDDAYGVLTSPEDLSYYQPANVTAGVVWNINPNTLFGLSGSYFLSKDESPLFYPFDKAQSLAINVSFNKRFDWGK